MVQVLKYVEILYFKGLHGYVLVFISQWRQNNENAMDFVMIQVPKYVVILYFKGLHG